jgi:putative ABC transport system permease protein
MRDRLRRLDRYLPSAAARDWFTPALHDLEVEWAHRRVHGGRRRRALANLRLMAGALMLYGECLKLSVIQHLATRRIQARVARSTPRPRKDYASMFTNHLRHALRLFRREPAFCAAAVITLALGIGANTALFAVVEAVLLRPLSYVDADGLVMLRHRDVRTGITKEFVALGDVVDLRARQQSLEALPAFSGIQGTLMDGGDPLRVQGIAATPDLFTALRVEPVIGRGVEPGDVRAGAPPVAIISHHLWTTRFGSAADITKQSVQIGTTRRMVVGVAPPGFRFPPAATTDIIIPMTLPDTAPAQRISWIHAAGRLRPGVSLEQANAEIAALSAQLESEFPSSNRGTQYDLISIREAAIGDTRRPLLLMLAAVGFVLLIACANVGNLLIARSLARQNEMAMRLALGAGRWRLTTQVATEALVLALAGGVVGVVIAWRAAPALAALVPQARSIPALSAVSINPAVLLFAVAVSLLAALLFSVAANLGLNASTSNVAATRRTTMSGRARRAASALVAVEVAMAVVLLIGAGLTLRSFANLISVDPGFNPARVLNVQIGLPPGRYPDAVARRAFYDRAFAAIESLPGVEAVGAGVVTPLTGNNWTVPLDRPERPLGANERAPDVGWQSASGGYFRTLGIPLRAGRLFDARDRPDTQPVVIISEALAALYFAGENPIGQRVRLGEEQAEIVGVVGDIRRAALSDAPRADMYLPFERAAGPTVGLFVRTSGDPLEAIQSVRAAIAGLEPNTVLYGTNRLEDIAAESAAVARLAMRLLGSFAIVALLLAAVGIYAVMSYAVRRRSGEFGTRLALGATRRDIIGLVMRHAALVAGVGLILGLGVGLAAARSLGTILYGVPPWDPVAVGSAVAILLATALLAGYVPARRAARIDPARTLAAE